MVADIFAKIGSTSSNPETALTTYFTDRKQELDALQDAVLASRGRGKSIFHIYGRAGSGKTALLKMFRTFCQKHEIPLANMVGKTYTTEIGVLETLCDEFKKHGASFQHFNHALENYIQQYEGGGGNSSSQEVIVRDIPNFTNDTLSSVVTSTEPIVRPATQLSTTFFCWKSVRNEVFLGHGMIHYLTNQFLEDFKVWTGGLSRPPVFIFDDYEQIISIDTWLCTFFQRLPPDCVIVVSGNFLLGNVIWDQCWPGWKLLVHSFELKPLNEESRHDLVARYYRIRCKGCDLAQSDDEIDDIINDILNSQSRYPLSLIMEVDLHILGYRGESLGSDNLRAIVDQLLITYPKTLQDLFKAASIVRRFNRDVLCAMTSEEDVEASYNDLIQMPFINQEQFNWWVMQRSIQTILAHYLKLFEEVHYRSWHEAAFYFYGELLKEYLQFGEWPRLASDEADVRKFEFEYLYHCFCLSTHDGLEIFCRLFERAFFSMRNIDYCHALLKEVNNYNLSSEGKAWIKFYEIAINHGLDENAIKTFPDLKLLLRQPDISRDLRTDILQFLGTIHWLNDKPREAKQYFHQCIAQCDLVPQDLQRKARALISLGNLEPDKSKREQYFNDAMNLCPELSARGRLDRERSNAYRLEGRFLEAEACIQSSISIYESLHQDFEKAHSLRFRAFLLVFMGKLREAEELLNESVNLFHHSGEGKREQAWPLIGLGDVAFGRGQYTTAEDKYNESIKICCDDIFVVAVANGGLAEIFCAQKMWKQAREYANKSLNGRREHNDQFGIGLVYNTLGQIDLGSGKPENALIQFSMGRKIMEDFGSYYGQSLLTLGICRSQLELNKQSDFNREMSKVFAWNQEGRDCFHDHLAEAHLLFGLLHLKEIELSLETGTTIGSLGTQISSSFANALGHAIQFNIFLLDRLANVIIKAIASPQLLETTQRNEIFEYLLRYWKSEYEEIEMANRSQECCWEFCQVNLAKMLINAMDQCGEGH